MPPYRVFIIHGYQSYPEEAWLPWLKAELVKRGHTVSLPAMPHPDHPEIAEWIAFVAALVGRPDDRTVLVGHSMGCQAVIRFLETVGVAGQSVAKTVLVAGGFPPGLGAAEAKAVIHDNAVLLPWFTLPVDAAPVRKAAGRCTVILSDDDPYIDIPKAAANFRAKLDPTIIIESGKGHYNEDTDVTRLPAALEAILS